MIAQQPPISIQQARLVPVQRTEPLVVHQIVGRLQLILAARRAAQRDETESWSTLARAS